MANKNNLTPVEEKYAKYFANPNVLEVLEDNNGKVIGIKMKDGRTLAPRKFAQEQSFVVSPSKDTVEQVSIEDISTSPIDFSIDPKKVQKEEKAKQREIKSQTKAVKNQGKEEIKKEKQAVKQAEENKKAADAIQKTKMMMLALENAKANLDNLEEIHEQNDIARKYAAAQQEFENKKEFAQKQAQVEDLKAQNAQIKDETKHQQFNLEASKQKMAMALARSQTITRQDALKKEMARLEKRKALSEEESKYLKALQKEQKNLAELQENLAVGEMNFVLNKEVINSQIKAIDNQQTAVNLKIAKLLPEGDVLNAAQLTIEDLENLAKRTGLSEEQQKKYSSLISDWKELQIEKDALKNRRTLLNKENRENLKKENINEENTNEIISPTSSVDVVEPISYTNLGEDFVNVATAQGEIQNINSAEGESIDYTPEHNLEHFALYNQEDGDKDTQNTNKTPEPAPAAVQEPTVPPVTPPPANEPQPQENAAPAEKPENKDEKKKDEPKKEMKTAPDKKKLIDPSPLTVDQHIAFGMMLMFALAITLIFGMPIFMYVTGSVYLVAALSASRPWIPTLKEWQEYKQKRFEKKAAKQLARDKQREKIVERTNKREPQIDKLKKQKAGVLSEIAQQKLAVKQLKNEKAKLKKAKETSDKYMQLEIIDKKINIETNKLNALKAQENSLTKQISILYNEEKTDKAIKKTVKKENKKLNALDENTLENYSLEQGAEVAIERTKLTELKNKDAAETKKEAEILERLRSTQTALETEKEQILESKKSVINQIASIAKDSGIDLKKDGDGNIVPTYTNAELEEKIANFKAELNNLDSRYETAVQKQEQTQKEIDAKADEFESNQAARQIEINAQKSIFDSVKSDKKEEFENKNAQIKNQIAERDRKLKTLKNSKDLNK